MTQPVQKPGRSRQTYATPIEFVTAVRRHLGIENFAIDLAADETNTVASRYFDEAMDSLSLPWDELWEGWAWLNPPFSHIGPWAKKCAECRQKVAFLVPAGVGANWFRDYVDGRAKVLLLNGRICFDGKDPYPKDCILALYGVTPGYEVWTWAGPARGRKGGLMPSLPIQTTPEGEDR
jgi:phage N-6-adenine-methyltransferase